MPMGEMGLFPAGGQRGKEMARERGQVRRAMMPEAGKCWNEVFMRSSLLEKSRKRGARLDLCLSAPTVRPLPPTTGVRLHLAI
jgi:hypothetical protein